MQWKNIHIFISSTFNDMHAERDYLVKNVFPELAEWCEQRKLRLIDIDLRWGITKADAEANDTVRKCLNGIDDSRPFFLCFLGQRKGWVPNDALRLSYENKRRQEAGYPPVETEINEATTDEYRRVGSLSGKSSVTEMEIEHALLNPMIRLVNDKETKYEKDRHSLFFFRENPFDENLDTPHRHLFLNDAVSTYGDNPKRVTAELEDFKNKVRTRFKSKVMDYRCTWKPEGALTPELRIPGLEGEEKQENEALCKGRLTDFSIPASCLNDAVRKQLEEEYPELLSNENIALKYVVIAGLMAEILDEYKDRKTPVVEQGNRYEQDLEQQELFARKASEGFIPVPEICDKLNNYIFDNERRPLLLSAEAGLGKSTLLAHCSTTWQEDARLSNSRFFIRFCGVSDMSADVYGLWNSIIRQGGMEVPDSLDKLRRQFLCLLKELPGQNGRAIALIDAVNQMQGGIAMLDWIPNELPEGVKLVVSIKQDEDTEAQIKQLEANNSFYILRLQAIRNDAKGMEQKEKLITEYLKRNLKALDHSHIRAICGNKASGNPLFLKILLSELRVFGAFKQLNEEISKYGDTPQKAFTQMLERLENDIAYNISTPGEYVSFLFGLMAHARKGLSEKELIRCFEKVFPRVWNEIPGVIRFFLRQARPFFIRHNGRFDFLYDAFKEAAREKYRKSGWHELLAQSLYDSRPGECAYHAREANNREYLTSIYTDVDFLNRYYQSEGAYALKAESHLAPEGVIPDEMMQFIDDTAALLEKHPEIAPATFYKELSSGFKSDAAKLCATPWLRMDKADTGIEESHTEAIKPASMQMENINGGCVAGNRKEVFLLTTHDTVSVVGLDSMQTLSTFTLSVDSPVEKLFCDADGHILVAVMRGSFAVYALQRDSAGGVMSCTLRATKDCRRIRFSGALAFAHANRLVYQTPENAIQSLCLRDALEEQSIENNGETLAGYFRAQQEYLLYKTTEGYRLTGRDSANVWLDSSVNDMICFNNKLIILPNNRHLLICDPSGPEVESRLELDFVPWCAVVFKDRLLMSDEHGALYTWHPRKGVKSQGMLAVEWDKNPSLFRVGTNKAFYFSNNRYALLAGVASSENQILQATIQDGKAEMLVVDSNNTLMFRRNGIQVKLPNPFRDSLYGMTSLLNYKCAWNPHGDILSMGNGLTAVLDFADGTQKEIAAPGPLSAIITIRWVDGMGAFVILYSDGEALIVTPNGQTIRSNAFQSSTKNYLVCECGKYFCILAKRRLVKAANLFEEEALLILDKDGHPVYEEHFNAAEKTIKDMAYDGARKNLYLISDTTASVLSIPDNFRTRHISFDAPLPAKPVGLAAKDGMLYYAHPEGAVCVMDLDAGTQIVSLPLHRNVSCLQSSGADHRIVLVENNERIYSVQLNK